MGPPLPRAEGRLNEAAGVPAWKPCFSNDCGSTARRLDENAICSVTVTDR